MALLGDHHLALHPTDFLLVAQLAHVFGIVGIVVDGVHGGELVIAVGEHALKVHVGEAEWPHDGVHATLAAPFFNGLQQGFRNLDVVDEVNPAKAHVALVPMRVGPVVDDGGHAAHNLSVAQGQEALHVAELQRRILLGVEGVERVLQEVGHGIGAVLVQFPVEANEAPHVLFILYTLDNNVG